MENPQNPRWHNISRPGCFGRRRDGEIKEFDALYGAGNWRLVWRYGPYFYPFAFACERFYEHSYLMWLRDRPADLDFICTFGECIDNAATNVLSGLDYSKQESGSTHIQDIAVRNVLHRLGRKFLGDPSNLLVIRGSSTNGHRFFPGAIPFFAPDKIEQPSMAPHWASPGSVEDFWQSNKWLQAAQS